MLLPPNIGLGAVCQCYKLIAASKKIKRKKRHKCKLFRISSYFPRIQLSQFNLTNGNTKFKTFFFFFLNIKWNIKCNIFGCCLTAHHCVEMDVDCRRQILRNERVKKVRVRRPFSQAMNKKAFAHPQNLAHEAVILRQCDNGFWREMCEPNRIVYQRLCRTRPSQLVYGLLYFYFILFFHS